MSPWLWVYRRCLLVITVAVAGCSATSARSGLDSDRNASSSTTTTGAGGDSDGSGGFDPGESSKAPPGNCGTTLTATVRDFSSQHPDFESYLGAQVYPGIVGVELGPDDKPVYDHTGGTAQTTGPAAFADWYNDTPDVNLPFTIGLELTEKSGGVFSYDNSAFFPIDGMGFGSEGNARNHHFTTEIHAAFTYLGGEVFSFTGDDDLWLFMNGILALDLGGVHPEMYGTVDLDARASDLGIEIGHSYALDIFHAERHTTESNFHIETTIQCFDELPK